MKRKEYLKTREKFDKEKSKQSATLDKFKITLSTGAFGVSFLFIENIVQEEIKCPKILLYSWIMFLCSIISSLLFFYFSHIAFSKSIEELDDNYQKGTDAFKIPIEDFFTSVFNWYSFGFLIIVFFSFVFFIYINLL